MNKMALVLIFILPAFVFSGTGGAAGQVPAQGELPRYLPPAQTRDEIIADELRKQEAQDREGPVLVIRFAAGRSKIRPENKKTIAKLAGYLEAHPDLTATLNGFTDNTGPPDENLKISEERARAVREVLIKEFRIDGSRIRTAGRGADNPVASNDTAAGRQKNRRVEAVIGSK